MRGKITKAAVDAMKPGDVLADTEVKGFVARKLTSGVVTYGLRYRASNRQRWLSLGLHGRITPSAARKLAQKRAGEVADNRDPVGEKQAEQLRTQIANASTVNALLDTYIERYVHANGLRSANEIQRAFDKYVRPRIGQKSIHNLSRAQIVDMLDEIEDGHGPVMSDRTLAYLRKAFNWHAARDESFVPPIISAMTRTSTAQRARKRVLDDQELRDVWSALGSARVPPTFPAFVRTLLLTAQRRREVADMRWEHFRDSVWLVPDAPRKKGSASVVPLSDFVLKHLGEPQKQGFVFSNSNDREKPFSGFSKAKIALDHAINDQRQYEGREPMPSWVLHDLRRTARSLMSRAGIERDVGERVLGHAILGVRGVYDRYDFFEEKRDALERLARIVAEILSPSG